MSPKNLPAIAVLALGIALAGCAGAKSAAKAPAEPTMAETRARAPTPAAAEPSKAPAPAEHPAASATLFERLGGMPAVEAVIADLLGNIGADERINFAFGVADLKLLQKRLVEFVCVATGGPCKYGGRDMRAVHHGMGVTNAQFDALVGDLVKSLEKFKVPEREKSELLGALGPLREQIVEAE
jgi:hemoglobin